MTPDTEWEKVVEEFYLNFTDIEKQELDTPSWNHNGVTPYLVEQWIRTLLTSRDTYWKERVRKEVEMIREEDAHDYCVNFQDGCEMCSNGTYNQALDTLLDNLK